jgi:transposase InsO family protein
VINILEENILARFGCPRKIVIDNAQDFKSIAMINLCQKYNIILGHSTTYYPQENGLAESSNKILMTIIKKVLTQNKKILAYKLKICLMGKLNWHQEIYRYFSFPISLWY